VSVMRVLPYLRNSPCGYLAAMETQSCYVWSQGSVSVADLRIKFPKSRVSGSPSLLKTLKSLFRLHVQTRHCSLTSCLRTKPSESLAWKNELFWSHLGRRCEGVPKVDLQTLPLTAIR